VHEVIRGRPRGVKPHSSAAERHRSGRGARPPTARLAQHHRARPVHEPHRPRIRLDDRAQRASIDGHRARVRRGTDQLSHGGGDAREPDPTLPAAAPEPTAQIPFNPQRVQAYLCAGSSISPFVCVCDHRRGRPDGLWRRLRDEPAASRMSSPRRSSGPLERGRWILVSASSRATGIVAAGIGGATVPLCAGQPQEQE